MKPAAIAAAVTEALRLGETVGHRNNFTPGNGTRKGEDDEQVCTGAATEELIIPQTSFSAGLLRVLKKSVAARERSHSG
jgi:hypothetical protein